MEWLWLLRWLLFLGPLLALVLLIAFSSFPERTKVGALFAFLYGLGTIYVTHQIAIHSGWWRYGGETLMLNGLPVDIWLGGAILFGPVLYLAFPKTAPIYVMLPIVIGLHGTLFLSLEPLVFAGPGWFAGTVFIFLTAHIPAIYLARWTAEDRLLPLRAALLAGGFGCLAFFVLPSVVMAAMGGEWGFDTLGPARIVLGLAAIAPITVIGLTAVQMFVVHGDGTPIPLDNTKRLVRTGIYAYLTNPMQLCSALSWIVIGAVIGNVWVASSALMAWVFVKGMVRWHHRHDLLVRFPEGWPRYRANVPEWIPRWRPWLPEPATLTYDPDRKTHRRVIRFLKRRNALSLLYQETPGSPLTYREPNEVRPFTGVSAFAKALNHIHLLWALAGATALLLTLPLAYARDIRRHLKEGQRAQIPTP